MVVKLPSLSLKASVQVGLPYAHETFCFANKFAAPSSAASANQDVPILFTKLSNIYKIIKFWYCQLEHFQYCTYFHEILHSFFAQ